MELKIASLARRPDLEGPMWNMADSWPEFMRHDPIGWAHVGRIAAQFPEYVLVATDERERVVAKAFSVPFRLAAEGRGELPATGWDQVLLWAFSDRRAGRIPDTVSAIEIAVDPALQGRGLSARMLAALRDNARELGFREVVAPLRPSGKHHEPHAPVHEYAYRTREADGLPHDPWLRVHVRAGGVVDSVAPASMTIAHSVERWREWTGLPFDTDGPVEVPGALTPVECHASRGYAVYVEPNVWVRHSLV
ncbi:GNAT family N-acetyltransferase [Streptomyces sp. NPDC001941]|uniref:GNAT family N-acetyltransferase n=1 Tax=Streptomyces sp. NPDC001941 TaxID=3154659 RepID=UPI0033273BF7